MIFDNIVLTKAHEFSFENEYSIKKSKKCGCFCCLKIFDCSEISDDDWCDDKNCKTALCPYCGIDSVLGDNDIEVSHELLTAMKKSWFGNLF